MRLGLQKEYPFPINLINPSTCLVSHKQIFLPQIKQKKESGYARLAHVKFICYKAVNKCHEITVPFYSDCTTTIASTNSNRSSR